MERKVNVPREAPYADTPPATGSRGALLTARCLGGEEKLFPGTVQGSTSSHPPQPGLAAGHRETLRCESCLAPCRLLGRVPGSCPLGASCMFSPVVTAKNVPRHCYMSPRGGRAKQPQLRSSGLLGLVGVREWG